MCSAPVWRGSIPAHAGEPASRSWSTSRPWVYPRPRGGADLPDPNWDFDQGLSPPTRGSPCKSSPTATRSGSIPAHAGEPGKAKSGPVRSAVYPRPRGGAFTRLDDKMESGGLSPPTRGSPGQRQASCRTIRSIPAHAGEPTGRATGSSSSRVYPRPRGGARAPNHLLQDPLGLSPPTRGSRWAAADLPARPRSIPAHAGEPDGAGSTRSWPRVYPRPRGGAG